MPIGRINYETYDFQNRIIANGGNKLSFVEFDAIDWYITALKREGIWPSLIALYPFVGGNGSTGSLLSFEVNLMSPNYKLVNGGGTVTNAMCTANGYQGSASYWDTGLASNVIAFGSISYGAYCSIVNDIQGAPYGTIIGSLGNSTYTFNSLSIRKTVVSAEIYDENAVNVTGYFPLNSNPIGFTSGSRNGTNIFIYGLGAIQQSITAANSIDYRYTNAYYIGALNNNGNPAGISTNRFSCPFIGNGLTQSQTIKMAPIQQSFESMLNRGV